MVYQNTAFEAVYKTRSQPMRVTAGSFGTIGSDQMVDRYRYRASRPPDRDSIYRGSLPEKDAARHQDHNNSQQI